MNNVLDLTPYLHLIDLGLNSTLTLISEKDYIATFLKSQSDFYE